MNFPLKEFTVYPKKDKDKAACGKGLEERRESDEKEEEILLLLREDGTFDQYASSETSKSSKSQAQSLLVGKQRGKNSKTETEMKGSWALIDGKLILATDRFNNEGNILSNDHNHDTIFEGRIVAVSDYSLVDNPALLKQNNQADTETQTSAKDEELKVTKTDTVMNGDKIVSNKEDVHLSVPKGKVKIGKFFYPKNHPSFFEQPIFDPTAAGSFELRQVLGNLNTGINNDEDAFVEKFKKRDLVDKRYFITSYPLSSVRTKRMRWSIKYNKYVGKLQMTTCTIIWSYSLLLCSST